MIMKTIPSLFLFSVCLFIAACDSGTPSQAAGDLSSANGAGQSGIQDETSAPNIVQVAAGSKDHTTLVAAVKAAGLADALSNAGPFTVFAPTNAAFAKLPAGTVEGLLEPGKKADLQNILEYHTYVGTLKTEYMQDGQTFEQVSGGRITITKKGDKVIVNGKAAILASIPTSNGIIHVIDEVLLPQ